LLAGLFFLSLGAHIFFTWTLEVLWYYLYLILGVGVLGVVIGLGRALIQTSEEQATVEFGAVVKASDIPSVGELVKELAKKLKSKPPQNIILGAAPTFYITNAQMKVLPSKKSLKGETVYISTTLARLLSKDELASIIAHELMHYRGKDLIFTQRFYPVYKTLANLHASLGRSGHLFVRPLLANLEVLWDSFSRSERRISRERELEADKGAAKATSPHLLANALSKTASFSHLWRMAIQDNAQAIRKGDFLNDATQALYGYVVYECDDKYIHSRQQEILKERISHPTDTHPTVLERLEALDVSPNEIETETFDEYAADRSHHLEIPKEFLKEITTAFHYQTMAMTGVAPPSKFNKQVQYDRHLDDLIYQVIEHFIMVDENLSPEEVRQAERLSLQYFSRFNPLIFRERLHGDYEPLEIEKLAEAVGRSFTKEGLDSLYKLIDTIIEADGRTDPREEELRELFRSITQREYERTEREFRT